MSTDEPPFVSPYYRWCDDPDCPVAWAYEDPPRRHWHFTGSPFHPAEIPDDADMR